MRIFNLTDMKPPFRPGPADPRVIRVSSYPIHPGNHRDLPDNIPLSSFSGLVRRGLISVGSLPEWYQKAVRKASDARTAPSGEED